MRMRACKCVRAHVQRLPIIELKGNLGIQNLHPVIQPQCFTTQKHSFLWNKSLPRLITIEDTNFCYSALLYVNIFYHFLVIV